MGYRGLFFQRSGAGKAGAVQEVRGDGEGGNGGCAPPFGILNICFIHVEFFFVSQGYCESRDIIYDHSANSVL